MLKTANARQSEKEGPHAHKKDRHVSDQDSGHVAILREDTVERETDSEGETRIPSIVDRPVADTGKINHSGSDEY